MTDFVTEKYQDQVAAILAEWSSSLLESPLDMQAVEKVLTSDFLACSLRPVESRLVRSGATLEVRHNKFARLTAVGRDAFLQELRSAMSSFAKILTAEFQVVSIDVVPASSSITGVKAEGADAGIAGDHQPPVGLRTRVRYELVGSGRDFYREQRVGHWDLEWKTASAGEFRLSKLAGS